MARFWVPFHGSRRRIEAAGRILRRFGRGAGSQAGEPGALGPRLPRNPALRRGSRARGVPRRGEWECDGPWRAAGSGRESADADVARTTTAARGLTDTMFG